MKTFTKYIRILGHALLWSSVTIISSCKIVPDQPVLVRSEQLSHVERSHWREALKFPSYCENGEYEWDDAASPDLVFLDFQPGKYLVYNLCDLSINQANIFLVNADKPSQPKLLDFSLPKLVNEMEIAAEFPEGEQTEKRLNEYTQSIQQQAKYELTKSNLVDGSFFFDEEGLFVIQRRNSSGQCGTASRYRVEENKALLVDFRAQVSCVGSSDIGTWKYYKNGE